ncbi:hypothetical protein MIMGU_mgv1a025002mg [Erythranthe guttata]|uniref:Uncharacterized protein n=1 Tax=Erythranthe guttata TaxID=4155 RepID=A0A022RFA0_ERYGU|nr:hypothetical protein MIMGU_mgv1a025002mg [Erythranthe guttata]
MHSLKEGVLLQLLAGGGGGETRTADEPVILQIRSIIPVLEEGDLFPNRGFFLQVSDSSHALYASLSDEQNELILSNKLKLGQLIHVSKLENSHPVPLLRGVTPIPGRRRCEGNPEDIVSQSNLSKLLQASTVDSVVEKGVILEKKISGSKSAHCNSSDSEASSYCGRRIEGLKGVVSKSRRGEIRARDFEKINSCNDAGRRSWNESEIVGAKEIFDSSVVRHEIKLPPRCRSANASPVRSVRYDSSDDNSSTISRRRLSSGSPKRLIKNSNKIGQENNSNNAPKANDEPVSNSLCTSLVYERKGAENGISWSSLPSNLVKFGKEVVRQRDVALLAAADALQEACASERLLNSLSTLSQFPLVEGDDLQPHVDKFFDLQEDLARTRLIMQSLTSITPFRNNEETESNCTTTNSVRETLNLALERKKNAIKWIKSAVALDLQTAPAQAGPTILTPVGPTKTSPSKPKGVCVIKKNKRSVNADNNTNTNTNNNIRLILASSEKENSKAEWSKGSTMGPAAELAGSLLEEYRKLFLSYVEKYLDEVDKRSALIGCDNEREVAVMMYKVKMVSDWLSVFAANRGSGCGNSNFGESEGGIACGRVRDKIYGILLSHVERNAALAFERD